MAKFGFSLENRERRLKFRNRARLRSFQRFGAIPIISTLISFSDHETKIGISTKACGRITSYDSNVDLSVVVASYSFFDR